MKVDQQIINDVITSVSPELWYLFLQMLVTVCITLLLYQVLKNLTAYMFVRFDKEISKNVKIKTDGVEGTISDINVRHLIIKNKEGSTILIPITKVNGMIWEIVKNGE
jgi:small-conductance mechanosensitive channel